MRVRPVITEAVDARGRTVRAYEIFVDVEGSGGVVQIALDSRTASHQTLERLHKRFVTALEAME